MHESLGQMGEYLMRRLSHYPIKYKIEKEQLEIETDIPSLFNVLSFLQMDTHCAFEQLMDLCAVSRKGGWEIIYTLLSVEHNQRLRLIVVGPEGAIVPSVGNIYRNSPWFEREIWDLFGVLFSGHEDLRRILMEAGFEGHPLRKDFPLRGLQKEEQKNNKKKTKEGQSW